MINDNDDDEVTVPTLRAQPRFSQRPTPLIPPQIPIKRSTKKYTFYYISIIIIAIIILSIIFIAKPLQSQVIYEHRIFNLPPIVIPANSTINEQLTPIKSEEGPTTSASSKTTPIIKQKFLKKTRDYGI